MTLLLACVHSCWWSVDSEMKLRSPASSVRLYGQHPTMLTIKQASAVTLHKRPLQPLWGYNSQGVGRPLNGCDNQNKKGRSGNLVSKHAFSFEEVTTKNDLDTLQVASPNTWPQ